MNQPCSGWLEKNVHPSEHLWSFLSMPPSPTRQFPGCGNIAPPSRWPRADGAGDQGETWPPFSGMAKRTSRTSGFGGAASGQGITALSCCKTRPPQRRETLGTGQSSQKVPRKPGSKRRTRPRPERMSRLFAILFCAPFPELLTGPRKRVGFALRPGRFPASGRGGGNDGDSGDKRGVAMAAALSVCDGPIGLRREPLAFASPSRPSLSNSLTLSVSAPAYLTRGSDGRERHRIAVENQSKSSRASAPVIPSRARPTVRAMNSSPRTSGRTQDWARWPRPRYPSPERASRARWARGLLALKAHGPATSVIQKTAGH